MLFFLGLTKFNVIKSACESMSGWKEVAHDDGEWNLIWSDSGLGSERLMKMKTNQRINHFVGTSAISRKNLLASNLTALAAYSNSTMDFFPQTWCLPSDLSALRTHFHRGKTYIVKPDGGSMGKGIYLARKVEDIDASQNVVVQRYVDNPLLVDNLKFDMRIYVLLAGCDPPRIFIFEDGLARFATHKYKAPDRANYKNSMMHLTNYSLNKNASNFEQCHSPDNAYKGHKRSLKHLL